MTMPPFDNDQVSLDTSDTSDEPVTDAAGQTVTADDDDAPLTAADLAHAKHAAAVATGQASVAPPPIETAEPEKKKRRGGRRAKADQPVSAEMLAPAPEPESRITGHQEIISTNDAQVIIDHKSGQALYMGNTKPESIPGKVVTPDDFPPENNPERAYTDMRKLARRRLKSVARFATRANEISRMWPRNPDGFFTAACKLSDDIERFGDANATHASFAATLCAKLLPRDTLDVLTMSELVFAR